LPREPARWTCRAPRLRSRSRASAITDRPSTVASGAAAPALAKAIEEAGDGREHETASAGTTTALEFYQNALDVIEAASAKTPDDPQLRSRKDELTAKIEARKSASK